MLAYEHLTTVCVIVRIPILKLVTETARELKFNQPTMSNLNTSFSKKPEAIA